MSDFEISCTLTPDVKSALKRYLDRKSNIIGSKLRTKLKESMEYLRDKISEFAPEGSSTPHLKDIIKSLPISGLGASSSHFNISENGKMSISIMMNRKKDEKIRWVNEGTGIFGPHHAKIVPTSGEWLMFQIDGEWIKVRSVRGQKGQKFIQKAVRQSKLIISSKIRSVLH
jgi:hypothetical protein